MNKAYLGIEFGSTRVKAVLIDEKYKPILSSSYDWENEIKDGYFTYSLEEVKRGLRATAGSILAEDNYEIASIGISGMMHGYLAFDKDWNLLVPFRTWRNTSTSRASEILTESFGFHIPQRWSIAHLYQAVLNGEPHVNSIAHITTLAGYVHYLLTRTNAVGMCEASGMFPLDTETCNYNEKMLTAFDRMVEGMPWNIRDILPTVLPAGETAGVLSESGIDLLELKGKVRSGIPFCPPEGDMGTGMVATNSLFECTGNISLGTSANAVVVLERPFQDDIPEIDILLTPSGKPVAMTHTNTCTGDLDAWFALFGEAINAAGIKMSKKELYSTLYKQALLGDGDCGGILGYNFLAGETVLDIKSGRPMVMREPDARLALPNFIRMLIYSSVAALKAGMDVLRENGVRIDELMGHGGLFKDKEITQKLIADMLGVKITVNSSAGEGGAWGIALLAAYMSEKGEDMCLEKFINDYAFADTRSFTVQADASGKTGSDAYMSKYLRYLDIQTMLEQGEGDNNEVVSR